MSDDRTAHVVILDALDDPEAVPCRFCRAAKGTACRNNGGTPHLSRRGDAAHAALLEWATTDEQIPARISRAISDPGSFAPDRYGESVTSWIRRAVVTALLGNQQ